MKVTILIIACAIGLYGCATPYQSAGGFHMGGGFGEKKISDSAYWVYFAGNGYASKERVSTFWLYRCAELTLQQGYDYMLIRPGEMNQMSESDPVFQLARLASGDASSSNPAVFRPDGAPAFVPVRHGGTTYTYIPGGTITTWTSRGTVLMYHAPLADELVSAYDARKLKDALSSYVTSGGDGTPPTITQLNRETAVTHEKVTFDVKSVAVVVDASSPPSGNRTPSGFATTRPRLRESSEIQSVFEDSAMTFHNVFRQRKKLEHREDGGSVVLSLVVTSNGIPKDCHVESSTYSDPPFVDALATLACRINFQPEEVDATSVRSLRITFAPIARPAPAARHAPTT